jgi:hypothetical protein
VCLLRGWREHEAYHAALLTAASANAKPALAGGTNSGKALPTRSLDEKDELMFDFLHRPDVLKLPPALVEPTPATTTLTTSHSTGGFHANSSGTHSSGPRGSAIAADKSSDANSKTDSSDEWVEVSRSRLLKPSPADIGHRLRLEVTARTGGQGAAKAPPGLPQGKPEPDLFEYCLSTLILFPSLLRSIQLLFAVPIRGNATRAARSCVPSPEALRHSAV